MPGPITPDRLDLARRLLDDGAGYSEASRTIGGCVKHLERRLPGYPRLTRAERAQRAAWARQLNKIKAKV